MFDVEICLGLEYQYQGKFWEENHLKILGMLMWIQKILWIGYGSNMEKQMLARAMVDVVANWWFFGP